MGHSPESRTALSYATLHEFFSSLETGPFDEEGIRKSLVALRDELKRIERRTDEMTALLNAMGRLGVFIKNYRTDEAVPNGLWRSLGYGAEEMRGNNFIRYIHPEDAPLLEQSLDSLMSGAQDISQMAYRVRGKDGEFRWLLSKAAVVSRDAAGHPEWLIGADFDITLRVRAEERARMAWIQAEQKALEAQTLLAATTVIASSLDWETAVQRVLDQAALVVPNDVTLVVLMSENAVRIVGGRRTDTVPVEAGDLQVAGEKNPFSWIAEERRPLSVNNIATVYPEFTNMAGMEIHSWLGVPLIVSDALLGCLTFARQDIGHYSQDHIRLAAAFAEHVSIVLNNAQAFRQMRVQATIDSLTEALSRRAFLDEARTRRLQCEVQQRPVSVIMIDLDHFKSINDEHGHATGDAVLKAAVSAWRNELRDDDILGRLGGEEFAVVLPGAALEAAAKIAERLRHQTELTGMQVGRIPVSASFGVSSTSDGEIDLQELLSRADARLYRAKRRGRNCVISDESAEG